MTPRWDTACLRLNFLEWGERGEKKNKKNKKSKRLNRFSGRRALGVAGYVFRFLLARVLHSINMVGDRTSAGWVCCVVFLWVDEAKELERLIHFDRIKDPLGVFIASWCRGRYWEASYQCDIGGRENTISSGELECAFLPYGKVVTVVVVMRMAVMMLNMYLSGYFG